MDIKLENQVRGTRIIWAEDAANRRNLINKCAELAAANGFDEIILPSLEKADIYTDKAGPEILGQMYTFKDRKDRNLCLRPEGTATCQLLAKEAFKFKKDVKMWYCTTCWRYERPQAGRYREFTQLGVEILNPTKDWKNELLELAKKMIELQTKEYEVNESVSRGLAYYIENGFEISIPSLGAQKQVCGGGKYAEGIGFAIGVDRLLLASDSKPKEERK